MARPIPTTFDWMKPHRAPARAKIDADRRAGMYRAEIEERAALLARLGHGRDGVRARLAANLNWDFARRAAAADRRGAGRNCRPPVRQAEAGHPGAPHHQRSLAMTKNVAPLLFAVVLATGAAACGVNEDLYNATLKDRDQQKQKLAETQKALDQEKAQHAKDVDARDARLAVLSNKLTSLGQDVSRLETERGNLGGELEQAQKRMEELRKAQAQAEQRAAQFRKLVTQFKALTDAGKLQVEIRENRMIVRLGDKILFDPGKTDLKPEGKDALTQVTAVLKTLPNRNFQVAGHTDNVPIKSKKFRSNWDLSTARAVEVTNFMIGAGMEPKRAVGGRATPISRRSRPTTRPRTWPRTGASRSRWSPTWTTFRPSTRR